MPSEFFCSRFFPAAALSAACFLHVRAATSPDGRTAFDFTVADGAPAAAVRYDGRPVATVRFGLGLAEPFADGFETADVKTRTVESGWKTVRGDRAEVKDAFAEENVTLKEKGPKGRRLVLELRAYDEGFAFRYRLLGDGAWEIRDERSSVTFPAGTAAWGIDATEATLPEKPFPIRPFPADAKRRTLLMPLTVQVPGACCASLLEAYAVSFPRAELTPFADGVKLALLGDRPVTVKGPFATPWRALVLGKDAAGLVEHSTLVLNLNPPCTLEDTRWIKPGLTVSNLSNCRLTEEDLEALADREYTNNVKYLQLDWGWYGTEWGWSDADRARYLATNPDMRDEPTWRTNTTGDARRVAKGIVPYTPGWVRSIPVDFDVEKLVRHLKDRGMGLCLYVRGAVLEKENVDDLFALYEKWGVAGVKPGFVRYGDAETTDWNREIIRLAAKHHLWVDVHDAQIPDGLERTYPNLFLTEGGGGEEGKHPVRQDVTLPFTRCLAGPFDYTPMFFFAGRSHAHLAAMLLAYPGPSAVLRGKTTDRFGTCPGFAWGPELDPVKRLPMTYDESRVLDAEIGRRIAIARRAGDTWFAAGVNGTDAHTATINCGFLTPGRTYEMKLVRDDLADGGPSCRSVGETRRVTSADLVDVPMAAAGGFLATFDPVPPRHGERAAPRKRACSLNGTGWTCGGMPVTVPHNWNIGDGADGLDVPNEKWGHRSVSSPSYERKKVCYARALPDPVKGRRTFVKCEGASVKAEMRVNGKVAGRHAGAYTAFCFEVTDLLKPSGNRLEIDVDNAYDPDLPPNEADFTVYGGLYRNVWLIETPRVCIDPTIDGGPGVAIDADPDTGRVTARVAVNGGTNEVQTFEFANPKLWSPETPDLYALTVKIRQGGCEDEVTETFGFRKAEFRNDGFYLNGRKRQIHGVCRHQERLGKGWAVSAADEAEDVRWMKKMGADGVRTSHYPDSPAFYDLCDRNGLLVWTEIPVVDDVPPTEAFKENAIRMAREMVAQHRNHPSVIVWGIFNEVYQYRKQDGSAEKTLAAVRDCVHALDTSRPVGGASNGNKPGLNAVPDVLGMNLYPGWYGAAADKMGEQIAQACALSRRSSVAVTEYGGGASVNQHADATCRPKTTDRFHPEDYQAYLHHGNSSGIRDNPRVWGSFAWVMFDFASDSRQEGEFMGINDKGLVTGDRRTAKDAFYLYKANWNPEPELHLVGEKMTSTTNATKTVVVFANTDDVWLRVNGRVIGMKHPDSVKTCVWLDVPLDPGPNEIDLRGGPFAKKTVWRRE